MIAGVSVPIEMVLRSMRADRRSIGVTDLEKQDLPEDMGIIIICSWNNFSMLFAVPSKRCPSAPKSV
jgi:hypothetical protein